MRSHALRFTAFPIVVLLVSAADGFASQQKPTVAPRQQTSTRPSESAEVAALRKAAERGDADAMVSLGIRYEKGTGIPQDFAQAAVWYRKAAEQGNAVAGYFLGFLYSNGRGVPNDYAQAVVWYRKGNKATRTGRSVLGTLIRLDRAFFRTTRKGSRGFARLEQGDAGAQYSLGYAYANGRGVTKDDGQAAVWYRKAADQGNVSAQFKVGQDYEFGWGVPSQRTKGTLTHRTASVAHTN
jgi:TPR repeat protein